MAKVTITATVATQVESIRRPDAERFDGYFTPALENISCGVLDGSWPIEKNQEDFNELRRVLVEQKDWLIGDKERFEAIKLWRESFPRNHWWWWVEDL